MDGDQAPAWHLKEHSACEDVFCGLGLELLKVWENKPEDLISLISDWAGDALQCED